MDNERKTYSIVGKVEIGTDEYRELIERCAEAKAEAQVAENKSMDRWREINSLNEKIKGLEKTIAMYEEFVGFDVEISESFADFLATRKLLGK